MKKELEESLSKLHSQMYAIEREKNNETNQRIEEEVEPLRNKARSLEYEIKTELSNKYKSEIQEVSNQIIDIKGKLDLIRIEEAKTLWHPIGTKLEEWGYDSGWSNRTKHKTGKVGVLEIYQDQDLKLPTYGKPKIGDLIIIHLKKDGTMGKLYTETHSQWTKDNWKSCN